MIAATELIVVRPPGANGGDYQRADSVRVGDDVLPTVGDYLRVIEVVTRDEPCARIITNSGDCVIVSLLGTYGRRSMQTITVGDKLTNRAGVVVRAIEHLGVRPVVWIRLHDGETPRRIAVGIARFAITTWPPPADVTYSPPAQTIVLTSASPIRLSAGHLTVSQTTPPPRPPSMWSRLRDWWRPSPPEAPQHPVEPAQPPVSATTEPVRDVVVTEPVIEPVTDTAKPRKRKPRTTPPKEPKAPKAPKPTSATGRGRTPSIMVPFEDRIVSLRELSSLTGIDITLLDTRWQRGWRGAKLVSPPRPRAQAIMIRHEDHDMTIREVADITGISEHTIRKRYDAGRRGADLVAPPRKKRKD